MLPATMIEIGKFNTLNIVAVNATNIHLGESNSDAVVAVLSKADAPTSCTVGDALTVFVYAAGAGTLSATLATPYAQVDEVAWLKVKEVNNVGAFLDWGLAKDVLLPYGEQTTKVAVGQDCLVKLFLDASNRVAASMVLDNFIQQQAFYFKAGEQVELMIADATDLGRKAIVNNEFWGVLYKDEIFCPLQKGQKISGYIKKIRADNKLDLSLQVAKYGTKVESVRHQILLELSAQQGVISLNDKSHPDAIYKAFGVSKKVFKQAIGGLYKQRVITLDKSGIRLLDTRIDGGKQ